MGCFRHASCPAKIERLGALGTAALIKGRMIFRVVIVACASQKILGIIYSILKSTSMSWLE